MWDAGAGLYFDYDTAKKRRSLYESCTALWALYAGAASSEQGVWLFFSYKDGSILTGVQLLVWSLASYPNLKCQEA